MIYVIISPVYIRKGDYTRYENALKIGYSSDNKRTHEGRFNSYITQNPTCEVLFKITGGTKRDEKNLHKYFSKYQKKFEDNDTREWFEYREEILDFFRAHASIDSIREFIKVNLDKSKRDINRKTSKFLPFIWPYIVSIREIIGRLDYSILDDYSFGDYNKFSEDWIKTYYPNESEEILNHYKRIQSNITSEMTEFIKKLRDKNEGTLDRRLRKLCKSEFTEEEKKIIAQQVSEKFDQYYNMVGPKRCAELGFNTTYIRDEIKTLSADQEKLISLIYGAFKVNSRYSNAQAKEMLKNIYEDCGIKQTAKASNLRKYFEVKAIQIYYSDKTKENGLEILGLKK